MIKKSLVAVLIVFILGMTACQEKENVTIPEPETAVTETPIPTEELKMTDIPALTVEPTATNTPVPTAAPTATPTLAPIVYAPWEKPTMEIVRDMGIGINLGNTYEYCGDWIAQWGEGTTESYETEWGSPLIK